MLRTLEARQAKLTDKIANTREQIMQELHEEGLTQVKTPRETVSIAKRASVQVDEPTWLKWLDRQEKLDRDMFYVTSLDKKRVTDFGKNWLKETGEIVPGLTPVETEYLSIRKTEKKEAKG